MPKGDFDWSLHIDPSRRPNKANDNTFDCAPPCGGSTASPRARRVFHNEPQGSAFLFLPPTATSTGAICNGRLTSAPAV
jgi:hypothetical protein